MSDPAQLPLLVTIFFAALAVTLAGTPLARRLALKLGLVDAPSERKQHLEHTPLLGGVAILLGVGLGCAVLLLFFSITPRVIGIGLALLIAAMTGLLDDRSGLPALLKLAGLALAVMVLLWFGIRLELPLPDWLNVLLTFAWLLGISSAVNFLDNMDGLAAGVSAIVAAAITVLAHAGGQHLVAALAAAVFGACLGFLRYNFRPASIFMGDAGSLFLGFVLALLALLLEFPGNSPPAGWLLPLFLLGLPIFDTTLVLVSRVRRRVNPFTTAGRDHLSHRLTRLGFSQSGAVLLLYLLSALLCLTALFLARATPMSVGVTAALAAVLGAVAIGWMVRAEKNVQSVPGTTSGR